MCLVVSSSRWSLINNIMFCVSCSFPQLLCEQDSQWNQFAVSCHVVSLDDVIQLMYHTSSIKPMAYWATVGSERACNFDLTKVVLTTTVCAHTQQIVLSRSSLTLYCSISLQPFFSMPSQTILNVASGSVCIIVTCPLTVYSSLISSRLKIEVAS